ncbi:MAG: response regulator [Gemmatimonadales bacterium]|nr:response regulator [Gemmatimonadales bacterium]
MARILVNDDDAHIRNTVRRALESRGHHVTLVSDGAAAEAALAQNPTDLLITDIFMPGQDGIVTLLHVRKTFPALKVIAMSGGDSTGLIDLRRDAEMLGAARSLAKPFTPTQLLEVVDDVLGMAGNAP